MPASVAWRAAAKGRITKKGPTYNSEAVRTADETAVGQLKGARLVITATGAERDEALSGVPPARHGNVASRVRSRESITKGLVEKRTTATKTTTRSTMVIMVVVARRGCRSRRGRGKTCCSYAASDGRL